MNRGSWQLVVDSSFLRVTGGRVTVDRDSWTRVRPTLRGPMTAFHPSRTAYFVKDVRPRREDGARRLRPVLRPPRPEECSER